MLIKYSVEFILCDCSRGNGILSSSLEKNISLMEKKNLDNPIKSGFYLQFCYNCRTKNVSPVLIPSSTNRRVDSFASFASNVCLQRKIFKCSLALSDSHNQSGDGNRPLNQQNMYVQRARSGNEFHSFGAANENDRHATIPYLANIANFKTELRVTYLFREYFS